MQQEHLDLVADTGFGDCKQMHGGIILPHGGVHSRERRGGRCIQLFVADAILVGQRLDGSPQEYQEGATSVGSYR